MGHQYYRLFVSLFALASASSLTGQITGRAAADAIARLTQARDVSFAGNSVDTGTGGFSLQATAVEVAGGRDLNFALLHDSLGTPAAIVGAPLLVGPGWTYAYAARLQGRAGGPITVHWDDLRFNRFQYSGGDYVPMDEASRYDELREINGVVGCSECAWRATREDGTVYLFDAQGVLRRIENKIGQELEIEKQNGRLIRVTEPISDRTLEFFYNPFGRIRYVLDPAGRRTYLEYDDQGLLAAIHNPTTLSDRYGDFFAPEDIPDGGTLEKTIDVAGASDPVGVVVLDATNIGHQRPDDLRVFLISPAGTEVEITDSADQLSQALDYQGAVISFFHGEDPNGRWTLRIQDQRAGQLGELNGFGFRLSGPTYPTRFMNIGVGQVAEAVDSLGNRLFANQFDGAGRVIAQDDGRDDTPLATFRYQEDPGAVVTTYTDRLGFEYRYEHDANYRLLRYLDPLGGETRYEYSNNGDRTAIIDALGRRTQLVHDARGNVTQVTDAAGNVSRMEYVGKNLSAFVDALGNRTRLTFNGGNITAVTDAEGNRDTRQYGGNGKLQNVLLEDGAGMDLGYNKGQPTSSQMIRGEMTGTADYTEIGLPDKLGDGEGNETELEYDERGNVIRRTDPLGNVETMEYDERNRLVRETDKNGDTTTTVYDGNSNVIERINALGESVRFLYDAGDRLVTVTDARGNVTQRQYDAVGRMIAETNAAGETVRRTYDEVGNLIAVFDAEDRQVASMVYDELDQVISSTDAAGAVSQTRYDAAQRPVELTDPLGRSVRLTYDKIGRLVRADDPLGRVTSQEFFSDDVVRSMTDGAGAETDFSYDDRNRVRQFTPSTGSVNQIEWEYDARGLPTSEELPGGAEKTYEYDDAGRMTAMRFSGAPSSGNRTYTYDPNGNLTGVSVGGGGPQLRRTFDSLDRVTSFTDANGDRIRYEFDENGNKTALVYPDGRRVEYEYDGVNRLIAVVDWADRRTDFTYDINGRLTGIRFPNGTSREMAFDAAGRLVRRRDLDASGMSIVDYRYRYDLVGQLEEEFNAAMATPVAYQPAAMAFTYLSDGRFETINGAAATYDPRGNLTSLPTGGGFATLAYDINNRLTQGAGVTYEYDGEERLTAWTAAGGRTRFTVDPHGSLDQLLVERSPTGATTRYVYGGGLLYEESGAGIRVFHYDQRGSAVAFTDSTGQVVGRVAYGPFGEVIQRSGDADSIFQFGALFGVLTDPSSLNYMRFRWYAPQLKRFLSPDGHYGEITDPSSLNRYIYAGNNPVNFVDPNGEFLNVLIGAAVGAVVNVAAKVVTAAVTGTLSELSPGDLIGAAIGGAITGGLIGACGPACGLAAGSFAAALGGGIGNAAGQGLDILLGLEDSFDPASLLVEVGTSAVFGALPFGKGAAGGARNLARGVSSEGAEAAAKRGARASASKLLRGAAKSPSPGGSVPIAIPWRASLKGAGKPAGGALPSLGKAAGPGGIVPIIVPAGKSAVGSALKDSAKKVSGDFGLAVGQNLVQDELEDQIKAAGPASPGAPRDTHTVRQSGNLELNLGQKSVYGEHAAWRFYQAVHTLAGRALPNNPNPAFPSF